MNKEEARAELAKEMQLWRSRSYSELAGLLDEVIVKEVAGPTGATYQIEIQIFWDAQLGGNLRVLGGIDDGGWSAFKPLSDSFIMAPDGTFIGE